MEYKRFLLYNVAGGIGWVSSMTFAGYFLGNSVPNIEKHVHWVILIVIVISFLPILNEWIKSRTSRAK